MHRLHGGYLYEKTIFFIYVLYDRLCSLVVLVYEALCHLTFLEGIFHRIYKGIPTGLNNVGRDAHCGPAFFSVGGFNQNAHTAFCGFFGVEYTHLVVNQIHIFQLGVNTINAFLSALSRAFTGPFPKAAVISSLPSTPI